MNKKDLLLKLKYLKEYILDNSYIEDYDGDTEDGYPIIRKVFFHMEEDSIKIILDKIYEIEKEIKES